MSFQHDGASDHYGREVGHYLDGTFPSRWIGRGGPIARPPRSPDLSCLDFFLRKQLKSVIYATPPESEEDLFARLSAVAGKVLDMLVYFTAFSNLSCAAVSHALPLEAAVLSNSCYYFNLVL